jgi:hypothetical protein
MVNYELVHSFETSNIGEVGFMSDDMEIYNVWLMGFEMLDLDTGNIRYINSTYGFKEGVRSYRDGSITYIYDGRAVLDHSITDETVNLLGVVAGRVENVVINEVSGKLFALQVSQSMYYSVVTEIDVSGRIVEQPFVVNERVVDACSGGPLSDIILLYEDGNVVLFDSESNAQMTIGNIDITGAEKISYCPVSDRLILVDENGLSEYNYHSDEFQRRIFFRCDPTWIHGKQGGDVLIIGSTTLTHAVLLETNEIVDEWDGVFDADYDMMRKIVLLVLDERYRYRDVAFYDLSSRSGYGWHSRPGAIPLSVAYDNIVHIAYVMYSDGELYALKHDGVAIDSITIPVNIVSNKRMRCSDGEYLLFYDSEEIVFVDIERTTLISDLEDLDFEMTIFPNPASELVYVDVSADASLELFDCVGRRAWMGNLSVHETASINVSGMIPGMYFMRVTNGLVSHIAPLLIQ